jgi:hypothetical protein
MKTDVYNYHFLVLPKDLVRAEKGTPVDYGIFKIYRQAEIDPAEFTDAALFLLTNDSSIRSMSRNIGHRFCTIYVLPKERIIMACDYSREREFADDNGLYFPGFIQ